MKSDKTNTKRGRQQSKHLLAPTHPTNSPWGSERAPIVNRASCGVSMGNKSQEKQFLSSVANWEFMCTLVLLTFKPSTKI